MGRSVSQIFQELGEASFRVQERDLMREILRKAAGVIAPGGGWAAVPGNRDGAKTGSVLAYLSVTPEIAAARLAADHSRPLLTGKDLLQELRHLLNEREASYRTAEIVVDAERGSPEIVAEAVVAALRCYADSVE